MSKSREGSRSIPDESGVSAARSGEVPALAPCPAWRTEPGHQGQASAQWDERRTCSAGFVEAERICARTVGTVDASTSMLPGTVSLTLNRFQFYNGGNNPVHAVQLATVIIETVDNGFGAGLSRELGQELQRLLNAANIMLAEPTTAFKHYGWCLYSDAGPNVEDCGPGGRDCSTVDHRVPVRARTLAGAGRSKDGGALHATLVNTAEYGPSVQLNDQIGSRVSSFRACGWSGSGRRRWGLRRRLA